MMMTIILISFPLSFLAFQERLVLRLHKERADSQDTKKEEPRRAPPAEQVSARPECRQCSTHSVVASAHIEHKATRTRYSAARSSN